jgi:heat-inducible transcriptional repressor
VRNVLARLEEQGFVRQPHTSAGRVPTDRGYRHYVDAFLTTRRGVRGTSDVEARFRGTRSMPDVLTQASVELSRASHHVGFAMAPAGDGRLRRIEFVPLEGRHILVIVVSTSGQVAQKVIDFDLDATRDELIQSANYLTAQFAGLTLAEARARVIQEMRAERSLYDDLLARSLQLARQSLDDLPESDRVFLSGTPTLVDVGIGDGGLTEEALPTLRTLLAMIEEKDRLVRLLTAYIEEPGLTVVIGTEHAATDFHPLSLVVTTFSDGDRVGAVGVLGPTRMRYPRAIAAVDSVSQAISRLLGSN